MANVVVNLGNTPINLTGNADLAKFAEQQLPTIAFNNNSLTALPLVPQGIVILTGLSQAGYLAGKGISNMN